MQIFFKWDKDNKTRTIEVDASYTVGQVKEKVADKIELEFGYRIRTMSDIHLSYGGRKLDNDAATLEEKGIQKEATLMLHVFEGGAFPATYDADVKPILAKDLSNLGETQTALFVFIGIGSYDNGHDEGIASVKRQQCPDALRVMCLNKGLKLRVLLIDKDFTKLPLSDPPQIYKVDTNWEWQKDQDAAEGKVRHYQYKDHDFQLRTYATSVFKAEYDGDVKTLAGINLIQLAQEIVKNSGFIIVGNFFKSSTKPHLAAGDIAVLKSLGYAE